MRTGSLSHRVAAYPLESRTYLVVPQSFNSLFTSKFQYVPSLLNRLSFEREPALCISFLPQTNSTQLRLTLSCSHTVAYSEHFLALVSSSRDSIQTYTRFLVDKLCFPGHQTHLKGTHPTTTAWTCEGQTICLFQSRLSVLNFESATAGTQSVKCKTLETASFTPAEIWREDYYTRSFTAEPVWFSPRAISILSSKLFILSIILGQALAILSTLNLSKHQASKTVSIHLFYHFSTYNLPHKPASWHTQRTVCSRWVQWVFFQELWLHLHQNILLTLLQPGYSSKRPIILDDSYASPETVALHEEGYEGALVARADSPRILMSAYGKPPPPQIHGNGKTMQGFNCEALWNQY